MKDRPGLLIRLRFYTIFFSIAGKPVPTELRNEGAAFTKELQYDEAQAGKLF